MKKGYRILSIEACDIYDREQKNGKGVGYNLHSQGSDICFWMFKNKLDYSLDTIELERVYKEICHEPFSFKDKYNNEYTRAVINVKFKYKYPPKSKEESEADKLIKNAKTMDTLKLREYFYEHGFCVDGVHYVRYKRSAGSSRSGKCLFIDERIYDAMAKWGECGLSAGDDLSSWEAYKALSLSSIKGTVNIPINGILFVPDCKKSVVDDVVSVKIDDNENGDDSGKLVANFERAEIENDIWDGESLIDESLFKGNYSGRSMLLLRNKFFKSCGFRTKLQKWIKDKGISLEDLKARGFVTLATDISQIVMVTTPNSLKFLKIVDPSKDNLNEENIRKWAAHVDGTFGVVKWDKSTKFFGGRMVRSSYQLLNTVGLSKNQVEKLLQPNIDYLIAIRNDIDFMRYHFSDLYSQEVDEDEDEDEYDRESRDGLVRRADVLFKLMKINNNFENTDLYVDFRDKVVQNQKRNMLLGHVLLSGTNATLFGNGPELLKFIAGEELESTLKTGQIWCSKFPSGQKLLCARSPHITMGNLYCVENVREGAIWNYFDLGENIVCVNAIGENIQQRLNGCDYDSDTMLITDDKMLIETAEKFYTHFKVPYCAISSTKTTNSSLAELDHKTSNNKIGEIVNLSQKLNSIIWDMLNSQKLNSRVLDWNRLNSGNDEILKIYADVCKLAVLSGLEIDKAKRAYDKVNAGKELESIRSKYDNYDRPRFFKVVDAQSDDKYRNANSKKGKDKGKKKGKQEENKKNRRYRDYKTAMQYIYSIADIIDFRDGKSKRFEPVPISTMLNPTPVNNPSDCAARDKIYEICAWYKDQIRKKRNNLRKADEDERDTIHDDIRNLKAERNEKVAELITNENVLVLIIEDREQEKVRAMSRTAKKSIATDWTIYAPILRCEMFRRILKASEEQPATVREDPSGEYTLYNFRYVKEYND